jgi:hypothetical protein
MASRNDTPNTPDVSETELRDLKVDELRERARHAGVSGTSGMRKEQLVREVARAAGGEDGRDLEREAGAPDDDEVGRRGDAGPDGGHVRRGDKSSKSLRYSQEVTSPDEDPERPGRSLVTTSHEVIRQWAEAREATPATVEGTEHGDHLGVLRFVFRGDDDSRLRTVSWAEWFETFDDRGLNFIYQEERSDGRESNFFRLENPEREDA